MKFKNVTELRYPVAPAAMMVMKSLREFIVGLLCLRCPFSAAKPYLSEPSLIQLCAQRSNMVVSIIAESDGLSLEEVDSF